jgi:hypothetical protein
METNQLVNNERRTCGSADSEEVSILREASSLRSRIAFDMASASRKAGVSVQTNNLVFASRDDLILASTAVADLESIDRGRLECGASVLFIYFSQESATIVPGFYTLRISGAQEEAPAASAWRGQLFDINGNFAAAVPVKVAEGGVSTSRFKVRLTGSVTEGGCTADVHWGKWHLEVTLSSDERTK